MPVLDLCFATWHDRDTGETRGSEVMSAIALLAASRALLHNHC